MHAEIRHLATVAAKAAAALAVCALVSGAQLPATSASAARALPQRCAADGTPARPADEAASPGTSEELSVTVRRVAAGRFDRDGRLTTAMTNTGTAPAYGDSFLALRPGSVTPATATERAALLRAGERQRCWPAGQWIAVDARGAPGRVGDE